MNTLKNLAVLLAAGGMNLAPHQHCCARQAHATQSYKKQVSPSKGSRARSLRDGFIGGIIVLSATGIGFVCYRKFVPAIEQKTKLQLKSGLSFQHKKEPPPQFKPELGLQHRNGPKPQLAPEFEPLGKREPHPTYEQEINPFFQQKEPLIEQFRAFMKLKYEDQKLENEKDWNLATFWKEKEEIARAQKALVEKSGVMIQGIVDIISEEVIQKKIKEKEADRADFSLSSDEKGQIEKEAYEELSRPNGLAEKALNDFWKESKKEQLKKIEGEIESYRKRSISLRESESGDEREEAMDSSDSFHVLTPKQISAPSLFQDGQDHASPSEETDSFIIAEIENQLPQAEESEQSKKSVVYIE